MPYEPIIFELVSPEQAKRLDGVLRELVEELERENPHIINGGCGRPHEYRLPPDVAASEDMMLAFDAYVGDHDGLTTEILYDREKRPEYLRITRTIGM